MVEKSEAPVIFFAPFVSSAMRVEPQWIDYNNHLNVAYYSLLFDRAVDECFALLGVGEDYVRARKASLFTAGRLISATAASSASARGLRA